MTGSVDRDMVPELEAAIEHEKRKKAAKMDPTLTAADRCDRCTAAALWRLVKPNTASGNYGWQDHPMTLDMCGHHWHEHGHALVQSGWNLVEQPKPTPA